VKVSSPLKKPFGKAAFSRIRHARYLSWEDAFDVEFEDGLSFLEPHEAVRQANGIASSATPAKVCADPELGSHFVVTYDDGSIAKVSWAFVREVPPGHC
jgi:hypothetical protein